MPVLQGVTGVTDQSGTNVVLPLDPSQVGTSLPNSSAAIQYVLNADIPYAAVQITDPGLYNRDLLLFETLARAAFIFDVPPISQIDPGGNFIGNSSVWATAQGTNTPAIPNAAEPLSQPTLKNPDLYLAERDNQVAAYVARVTQALKNPFAYASRIYVQIDASGGGDAQESETYVLTDNLFISGNTYTAGEQVLYGGAWYQAINTTTDTPPSSNWSAIDFPTQRQFLADPSLDSRNRIVYDTAAQTLQWFRETLDLVHIPQIVGFYVPGIFPDQTIQTVAAVPERKDAQFYRQKSSRVEFSTGTYSSQQVFNPTGNNDPSSTYVVGGLNTLFQSTKYATLTIPDNFTVNFENLICNPGTYALDCLVRPCPEIAVAGGDNQQGFADSDGGTTYSGIGDVRNWELALPAGSWTLFVDFSNASASPSSSFGIKISQGAVSILANTLPLYYTDSNGNPLPQGSIISSPGIALQSAGQVYNFNVQWTSGAGQFHITRLRFVQTNGPDTSHYIMQAKWLNADGPGVPSVSNLNVIGQADMPDAMPFRFYMAGTDLAPAITLAWLPNSAAAWQAVAYAIGDQVLYNLIYWQATAATKPTDVPGQSPFWTQIGQEPQIPLLFEQIQLSKLVETIPTPEVVGFQGFRQDMLERALRADQDAYTKALSQVGTNFPEFRDSDNSWTLASTGSWMTFIETYQPRLRQAGTVASGDIVQDRQYEVITQTGESVTYNGVIYSNSQKFYGIGGLAIYASVGQPIVNQVGAYRLSHPADIGKTGLVPAGIEYVRTAGTGTVYGWYPSYASYPTHQAILPWMIEQGFYVADDDFQSPDGNVSPPGSPDNPPVPHPAGGGLLSGLVTYYRLDETTGSRLDVNGLNPLGEVNGPISDKTGIIGNALSLDPTAITPVGVISAETPYGPYQFGGAFSVSFWVKTDINNCTVLGYGPGINDANQWGCSVSPAHDMLFVTNTSEFGDEIGSEITVDDDAWHHIVCIYDLTDLNMYQDNVAIPPAAASGPMGVPDPSWTFWIGKNFSDFSATEYLIERSRPLESCADTG